jgi:probable rRNA maturation factor
MDAVSQPLFEITASGEASQHISPDWSLDWLAALGRAAWPQVQSAALPGLSVLDALEDIEVTLLTDAEIAQVHAEFLQDPTPTDVITFHHGEILISIDTAARQAVEHGQNQPVAHEIALYLIHGLLHLGGWDDHEPEAAAAMAAQQQAILDKLLGGD